MKKILVTMPALLLATLIFAQKIPGKNVPASVRAAFEQNYPTATEIKWDKEAGNYEASFELNKKDNSVLIDVQGNIIETEVEIELSQLPQGILDHVRLHYAGKKIKETAKITDAKGIITYEVEIKGLDLIFDGNGKFIKEIKG
jgi:hypothetical protein